MRTFVVAAIAVALLMGSLGAQEEKKVPKDSMRVSIPGCVKGYIFTAGRRTVDEPGSGGPEGRHFRMNGPKKLIEEIKAQEGSMIMLTGLTKKGQFEPGGTAIGGGFRVSPGGAQAALEILEFANSQLLEFRYYDERLDNELAAIYGLLQRPRWYDKWLGSRYARAARQVHSLFIDVNELTDRTENTLKFVGDIYAARLFAMVASRLALQTWKGNVQEKLKTLDDVYRFAVEQSSISRGQLMELVVVLILVLELALVFLGVTK